MRTTEVNLSDRITRAGRVDYDEVKKQEQACAAPARLIGAPGYVLPAVTPALPGQAESVGHPGLIIDPEMGLNARRFARRQRELRVRYSVLHGGYGPENQCGPV